jgi:hypothetical protein
MMGDTSAYRTSKPGSDLRYFDRFFSMPGEFQRMTW